MAFMEAIIHEKLSFLTKKSIIQLLDLESSLYPRILKPK